ncbi:MAG: hypothetical protein EDM05_033825 [Leptolyngbya sp. IPPAS B-1204]|nr:MAG: hypothetical protein EDM05_20510 [Leptolyngbya sp. IPPAS B-1204]
MLFSNYLTDASSSQSFKQATNRGLSWQNSHFSLLNRSEGRSASQLGRLRSSTNRSDNNQSDNRFATARSLGIYRGGKLDLKINDTLGKKDRVDIYALTVPSGVTLPSGGYSFKVDRGTIRYSLFGAVPALGIRPQFAGSRVFKGSDRLRTVGFENPYAENLVVYIRFDRPSRDTKYRFRLFS